MTEMVRTETQAYKDRFIAKLISIGFKHEDAVEEYFAWKEGGFIDEISDPECDALECAGYYGD